MANNSALKVWLPMLASVGLLLIAIATLIPIVNGGFPHSPLYKIIFTVGAVLTLVAALFNRQPKDLPLRERRWARIESWSSIFFCTGALMLWWPGSAPRDWLAFTLAGAVIRVICFFRSARKVSK